MMVKEVTFVIGSFYFLNVMSKTTHHNKNACLYMSKVKNGDNHQDEWDTFGAHNKYGSKGTLYKVFSIIIYDCSSSITLGLYYDQFIICTFEIKPNPQTKVYQFTLCDWIGFVISCFLLIHFSLLSLRDSSKLDEAQCYISYVILGFFMDLHPLLIWALTSLTQIVAVKKVQTKKAPAPKIAKQESSDDDTSDETSESDEEHAKKPAAKPLATVAKNGSKTVKQESSSDEDSSEDESDDNSDDKGKQETSRDETSSDDESDDDKPAAPLKKTYVAILLESDSDDDSDEEVPPKSKAPAATIKKKDSSESESESDSEVEDASKTHPTKRAASKMKDESSDDSDTDDDEEPPQKNSSEDEDDSSEESSDDEPTKVEEKKDPKVSENIGSEDESSKDESDKDSEEPANTPKKAPVHTSEKQTATKEVCTCDIEFFIDGSFQKAARGNNISIFIWGFDKNISEDEIWSSLEQHFSDCGEMTRVSIPTDHEPGAIKGECRRVPQPRWVEREGEREGGERGGRRP
ncbi:hypothetical protein ACJX0J_026872, partial [Zea mays]